jgi:hypothetical protein
VEGGALWELARKEGERAGEGRGTFGRWRWERRRDAWREKGRKGIMRRREVRERKIIDW